MSTNHDRTEKPDGRNDTDPEEIEQWIHRSEEGTAQLNSQLLGDLPLDTVNEDATFVVEVFPEVGGGVPLGAMFDVDGRDMCVSVRPLLSPDQARELGQQLIEQADYVEGDE